MTSQPPGPIKHQAEMQCESNELIVQNPMVECPLEKRLVRYEKKKIRLKMPGKWA